MSNFTKDEKGAPPSYPVGKDRPEPVHHAAARGYAPGEKEAVEAAKKRRGALMPSALSNIEARLDAVYDELSDLVEEADALGLTAVVHKIEECHGKVYSAAVAASQYVTGTLTPRP